MLNSGERQKAAKRFLIAGLLLMLTMSAYAQQGSTGSIAGTVADPTGQVVPSATVKVTSELNGESHTALTDESGDFFFGAIAPGSYTLRVEASGFRPLEQKGNVVLPSARLVVGKLALAIGSLTESVQVTAQTATVATTTSAQQTTIDSRQMDLIAVKGRDPMSVFKTLAGVQIIADQDTWGGSFQSTVPQFQGRGGNTVYTDGVNGGDSNAGQNYSGITSMDAIAEVNVQANGYTAEYGFKSGAQMNIVTKQGGSDFHGTAAWYVRNEAFNAQNFFNNRTGVAKPRYRYSDTSATIGGPVPFKIPVINPDGHKFNFFYSVEDMRLKDVQPLYFITMPTALEKAGNFSQTKTPAGALIPVKDPTGTPYPGNIIPASQSNAFGATYLSYFPLPNTAGASGYNYTTQEPSINHPRRAQLFRYDVRLSDKDTLSVKQQTWFTKSTGWGVAAGPGQWGLFRDTYDFTADQGKIDYTRIITPHLINQFSAGMFYSEELGPAENALAYASIQKQYDRFAALGTCAPPHACTANGTLVSPGPLAGLKQINPAINPLGLIPRITLGSLQNNSQTVPTMTFDTRLPLTGEDSSMPFGDNVTYTRGAHVLKLGVLRVAERTQQARASNFSGQFDFSNDANDPLGTGFAYSNMFTGHVTAYTEDMGRPPSPDLKQVIWAWFAQDTWKVRKNVTLDVGLRMYQWSPRIAQGGEASEFAFERFDPKWGGKPPLLYQPTLQNGARRALNTLTGEVLPASFIGLMIPGTGFTCGPITPKTPCKINGVVNQDDPNFTNGPRGFWNSPGVQYDPRVGIAWDPMSDGKMVVRVGMGAYHDSSASNTFNGGPGFQFTQTIRYTDMNSYYLGTGPTSPANVTGTQLMNEKLPVTYQYNLGIQKDVGFKTVVDIAYVGSNTHHTPRNYDYNLLPSGIRFLPSSRDITKTASAASPGAYDDVFLRPIQGFQSISINMPGTASRYDSLQISANRRFLQGFTFSGAYTFAGGTADNYVGNSTSLTQTGSYQQLPSSESRSRNTLVQHNVLVFSYTADLPKGSKLIPGAVSKVLFDGWQFQGVSTFANGQVQNVTFAANDGFDFSGGGEVCGTGIVQTGSAVLPRGQRTVDNWFNAGAFKRPSGRGDLGNNCDNAKFTQPGFNNQDWSLFKKFNLKSEKKTLEFRAETFNTLNHTQFSTVGTTAAFAADGTQTNTTFGKVTAAKDGRKMMFGLKFSF